MTNDTYYESKRIQLQIYKERLAGCPDNKFYKNKVSELESDIATMNLMREMKLTNYQEFTTNSLSAVIDIIRNHSLSVVELDIRWSWKHFKWMYYIKYFVV